MRVMIPLQDGAGAVDCDVGSDPPDTPRRCSSWTPYRAPAQLLLSTDQGRAAIDTKLLCTGPLNVMESASPRPHHERHGMESEVPQTRRMDGLTTAPQPSGPAPQGVDDAGPEPSANRLGLALRHHPRRLVCAFWRAAGNLDRSRYRRPAVSWPPVGLEPECRSNRSMRVQTCSAMHPGSAQIASVRCGSYPLDTTSTSPPEILLTHPSPSKPRRRRAAARGAGAAVHIATQPSGSGNDAQPPPCPGTGTASA
jgi:hypothetical protein